MLDFQVNRSIPVTAPRLRNLTGEEDGSATLSINKYHCTFCMDPTDLVSRADFRAKHPV